MPTKISTDRHSDDGQVIHPMLGNTAKDGSGSWNIPRTDANGNLIIGDGAGDGIVGTLTPTPVVVDTTPTLLLSANANAEYRYLKNISKAKVVWSTEDDLTLASGIDELAAGGGWYEMSRTYHNLYRGAIYAIASAGNATVLVSEGVA